MRLNITPYCQMIRPMQIYHGKTTREDKPAPEMRWIVGENIRIIGFDEFVSQLRLSVVRLDGESCKVSSKKPTEFFTEVPATNHLESVVNDTEVVIDTESSQSHLTVCTNDLQYKIKKILGSEPLEFRQLYLPINQPIAEGSILSERLNRCINYSPGEVLEVKIIDGNIKFVSKSKIDRLQYSFTEMGTVYPDTIEYDRSFDLELLSKMIAEVPTDKQIQFFITEEFIRFRYEIGNIGYMNYYQRVKHSRDMYII